MPKPNMSTTDLAKKNTNTASDDTFTNILQAEEFKSLTDSFIHVRHATLKAIDTKLKKLNQLDAQLATGKNNPKLPMFSDPVDKASLKDKRNDLLEEIHDLADKALSATNSKNFVSQDDYKRVIKSLEGVKVQAFAALPEEEAVRRFKL